MVINLKNNNIQKALKIAKETYKVKCVFRKRLEGSGSYSHKERTMLLYVGSYSEIYTVSNFISTVFHELGHAHCYDNNIYPEYHIKDKYYVYDLTKKEVKSYIS